jgi:NitT/TauT family transport system substrate-binding protein
MSSRSADRWSRREFLTTVTAAGTGVVLGLRSEAIAAEPPPETTKLRTTAAQTGICAAGPKIVAEALWRAEGFTDVEYQRKFATNLEARLGALASNATDIDATFVGPLISRIDAGDPIVILSGLHAGCFELFGGERVRAIRDLKGKTVAVSGVGGPDHAFIASMLAYVGLDARRDVSWVALPTAESIERFANGKVDAFMGFPTVPQELRARGLGRVVVNSAVDRPWSQYFCCLVAANREFVRKYPIATKRALRAILKAVNICAVEPDRAATTLVEKGITPRYEIALQTMKDIPYGRWSDYDVEDTMRFYALRLHEAGMIKSSPQKIIAQGTDWRFLRELKKELKA